MSLLEQQSIDMDQPIAEHAALQPEFISDMLEQASSFSGAISVKLLV